MPVYKIGDLVSPDNPWGYEENPDAIGIILEMRSMLHQRPEARVLWNDMLDAGPKWTFIQDVKHLEQQACNGQPAVV
jgi:hypothetical protein